MTSQEKREITLTILSWDDYNLADMFVHHPGLHIR